MVYDWKPPRCEECNTFGHSNTQCPKVNKKKQIWRVKTNNKGPKSGEVHSRMESSKEDDKIVEINMFVGAGGEEGSNVGNRFAPLVELDNTDGTTNPRDETVVSVDDVNTYGAETNEHSTKIHVGGSNLGASVVENIMPNAESNITNAAQKTNSSNNSSLRGPIETRDKKNNGIVINEGATTKSKRVGSQSNNKIVRHD